MTNVPNEIRDMWREIYVLFDTNYKINVSNPADWQSFWKQANAIYDKSGQNQAVLGVLNAVADLIVNYSRQG